jgi:hypothetical protein
MAWVELGQPRIEGTAAGVPTDAALRKIPGEGAKKRHEDRA